MISLKSINEKKKTIFLTNYLKKFALSRKIEFNKIYS